MQHFAIGIRPRLQRRDRDGFAPSSLFFGLITDRSGTCVIRDFNDGGRHVNTRLL